MIVEKYIGASCVISGNAVFKNGEKVFENIPADLPSFLLSLYRYSSVDYPKFYKMDNLSKLGWLAAELLLQGAKKDRYLPEEMAVILSNANSSLDTDLKYFDTIDGMASPSLFVYTLPNIMTGEICIRNNFKGENAFFVSEDFDSAFIHQYVSLLLDQDNTKSCICGWVDVYGDEYKAALLLVNKGEGNMLFTRENIDTIFKIAEVETNV